MPAVATPATLTVTAPASLNAGTRVDFRAVALDCLDRAGELGAGSLTIDLTGTDEVDASGLGLLVMLHKRAKERGVVTVIAHPRAHIRSLLKVTKLASLFEFEQ
ncbi:MAG: STAS domain-containing protein [Gemmatimonadaceae bacterium]